ncbi:MAG: DNA internalization-related competence protein ComEC/Rec2, partial [Enterobacteriaceae bacterium]
RLNEGGFDRQRWSIAQGQVLTGKVLSTRQQTRDISWRQRWANGIAANLVPLPMQDVIWALAMGERSLMSEPHRVLLQQTGTAHLMAISGLHISLAALFGWSLLRLLQGCLPQKFMTPLLPLLGSLLMGWGYVWLSGANPPALRAGMALLFWSLMRLSGTNYSAWQLWLRGIAVLLLVDPFCLLSDSFWLSCGAVAGLIFWYQWLPLPHALQKGLRWLPLRWLHLQTGIFLLLAPLQVLLFQGVSGGALIANLWAVPLVSLLCVPLILLALMSNAIPVLGAALWWLADLTLQLTFYPLPWFAKGWYSVSQLLLPLALSGWLLIPALRLQWWRSQTLSLLSVMLLLLWPRWRSADPVWRVTMLDVGHGLSMVIERNGHAIVYDTGNAWPGGSMAQLEILPY